MVDRIVSDEDLKQLWTDLCNHIGWMAPHQKERAAGLLLIRCREALSPMKKSEQIKNRALKECWPCEFCEEPVLEDDFFYIGREKNCELVVHQSCQDQAQRWSERHGNLDGWEPIPPSTAA